MPKKYPPLTPQEVRSILSELGFIHDRTKGSYEQWKNNGCTVTVKNNIKEFGKFLIKSMIRQSGFSREEFYGASKKTAKKIQ